MNCICIKHNKLATIALNFIFILFVFLESHAGAGERCHDNSSIICDFIVPIE